MKKLTAICLALAMVLSLAACGGNTPSTTAAPTTTPAPTTPAPATTPPTTPAPTEPATPAPTEPATPAPTEPTTPAPTEPATPAPTEPATPAPTEPAPEPEVVTTIQVINTLLADLEAVSDPLQTLYNTYWLQGYNVGKLAVAHFWFTPEKEELVKIISYVDQYVYAEELPYELYKEQAIVLDLPEALQENYTEGLVAGTGIVKNQFPYHVGMIVSGPEAIILTPAEGYVAKYLFEDIKMAEADAYDFVCADGYKETIDKEDLEKVEIFFNEGRVDASSIAFPEYTLQNILYVVPEGLEADKAKEMEVEKETVYKITVMNTVAAGAEADTTTSFGGTLQTGYRVADILSALKVIPLGKEVKAYSLSESITTTMEMDEFTKKFFVPNDSKDRGGYTVGPNQQYGDVTINTGFYDMDGLVLFYLPELFTKEAGGVNLVYALEMLGITDYKTVRVICADGYAEEIDAEDLGNVGIFHIDGRIDTNSIAYPEFTLQNAVTIEVLK